jgi:hypothetical protein
METKMETIINNLTKALDIAKFYKDYESNSPSFCWALTDIDYYTKEVLRKMSEM